MKNNKNNYGSIPQNEPVVKTTATTATTMTPSKSNKRNLVVLGLVVVLSYVLFYVGGYGAVTSESVELHQRGDSSLLRTGDLAPKADDECDEDERLCNQDSDCGDDRVCCPYSLSKTLTGRAIKQAAHFLIKDFTTYQGVCEKCCVSSDCMSLESPPPVGSIGTPVCNRETFVCQAYANNEYSQIPDDGGFPTWIPSETKDNSRTYNKIVMPRTIRNDDTPIMDQVWVFDLNEQDPGFRTENVVYDPLQQTITLPAFDMLHAGYSRSYNHFDQHDTGITTLVTSENTYSLVTPFPKVSFAEKYHTLTYSGGVNPTRAAYVKSKADQQMFQTTRLWGNRTTEAQDLEGGLVFKLSNQKSIISQVDAALDFAHLWQIRRYVQNYPHADEPAPLSPSTSDRWKQHAAKANQAIEYAKDPSFERELLKSEQHCKHFESGQGVETTPDSVTFPLGKPLTTLSGEMVVAPEYTFGIGGGYTTAHYDPETKVLQMYLQTFSHSRQSSDAQFPGYYPDGLVLTPVANRDEYAVSETDGRLDFNLQLTDPDPPGRFDFVSDWFGKDDEADYTLWNRPQSEVCDPNIETSRFWNKINIEKRQDSVFDLFVQLKALIDGAVKGMPCATAWMRSDYGPGTHAFGINEIAVWLHTLGEIRGDKLVDIGLGNWWNSWECFYQNKDPELCTNFG